MRSAIPTAVSCSKRTCSGRALRWLEGPTRKFALSGRCVVGCVVVCVVGCSVMDDNKVLTLPSNERIPLRPPMRLLFEVDRLTFASPATVSRAGNKPHNPKSLKA
eukprot:5063247-Pyramimonas_sp.AAC.2